MSISRGFGLNGKSSYVNVAKPMTVWCNFIVDAANGNGLGIRSLKSNGYVEAVFMHTSSTPGNSGALTNPNPALGYALVRFKNNFNVYLGGFSGQVFATTSNATTSTTTGNAYVITTLGTTTLAQWVAAGLPVGFTPAVGAAFVAKATGAIGGTGTVGLPGIPTGSQVTVVGSPAATIGNNAISPNAGASILLQFTQPTSSSVTTLVAANPADGTVVGLNFQFDGSTVTIDGL